VCGASAGFSNILSASDSTLGAWALERRLLSPKRYPCEAKSLSSGMPPTVIPTGTIKISTQNDLPVFSI